jgi:hypothetical protein
MLGQAGKPGPRTNDDVRWWKRARPILHLECCVKKGRGRVLFAEGAPAEDAPLLAIATDCRSPLLEAVLGSFSTLVVHRQQAGRGGRRALQNRCVLCQRSVSAALAHPLPPPAPPTQPPPTEQTQQQCSSLIPWSGRWRSALSSGCFAMSSARSSGCFATRVARRCCRRRSIRSARRWAPCPSGSSNGTCCSAWA